MADIASVTSIPSAVQSATNAIQRSNRALAEDANVVARGDSVMSKDVVAALIDSRQQVLYTQAAAKLIAASDEITQSLIDIRA